MPSQSANKSVFKKSQKIDFPLNFQVLLAQWPGLLQRYHMGVLEFLVPFYPHKHRLGGFFSDMKRDHQNLYPTRASLRAQLLYLGGMSWRIQEAKGKVLLVSAKGRQQESGLARKGWRSRWPWAYRSLVKRLRRSWWDTIKSEYESRDRSHEEAVVKLSSQLK